jgi:hypothetical protein
LHQALPLEHGIGEQEAVGRHQIDLRPRRPSRQQRLEHARGGRFAHRHRSGDADNVGHLAVFDAEKAPLRVVQPLCGIDIDRQQTRQRQIDLLDLPEIEPVVHRAKCRHLVGFQRHRGIVTQPRPLLPGKYPVGVVELLGCPNIHDAAFIQEVGPMPFV